jgi:hypothetical protein
MKPLDILLACTLAAASSTTVVALYVKPIICEMWSVYRT